MKGVLQRFQAPVLVAMILMAPASRTLAANDQFQSASDLLGTPQPQSSTPPENTGTPAETAKLATETWIQEQQAKAANKEVEKAKQQGVKPAL